MGPILCVRDPVPNDLIIKTLDKILRPLNKLLEFTSGFHVLSNFNRRNQLHILYKFWGRCIRTGVLGEFSGTLIGSPDTTFGLSVIKIRLTKDRELRNELRRNSNLRFESFGGRPSKWTGDTTQSSTREGRACGKTVMRLMRQPIKPQRKSSGSNSSS